MQRNRWGCLPLITAFAACFAAPCGVAADLKETLTPLLKAHRGEVGVAVKHLKSGVAFRYRADVPMPTASLIKLPVMIETYRQSAAGQVDLDEMLTLGESDKVPGSGILRTHFSAGTKLSLRDAVRLMMAYSDNTATNLVLDRIGLKSTSATMEKLGFAETKIHAKVYRRDTSVFPERSRKYGLGSTTADDMLALLERLEAGRLADKQATAELTEHLLHCENKTRLPGLLPTGTKVAHKTGSVSKVRTDAGIIFSPSGPIAVCVLTAENADRRWSETNAGHRLCAQVAKIAYDHFNAKPGSSEKLLQLGAGGRLVEDLQRTLNARLNPSPELSLDGEFGENTRAAVQRFQRSRELAANGVVDAKTWKALGPLVTQNSPVPSPDVVNNEKLERRPADDLDGPPHVTCKAWAIAGGKAGKMLWSRSADRSLDIASTTKIMTAYVVLQHAEAHPDVLKERVTFSTRADGTGGSTANIRAGESLTVRELLYGLMLPSGNDASVALAEHFGDRFAAPKDQPAESDPLPRFIAEMNRAAAKLGMNGTTYKNPHGLTARGHRSTAGDLLKLAHAALRLPKFREYVNTRQHGCELRGTGGYTRNIVWKNTNRLLAINGYDGVKTGTTSAAGACLVSSARRGDDHLLMVVLGATSSDARYVDSRNLYRWAWRERLQSSREK